MQKNRNYKVRLLEYFCVRPFQYDIKYVIFAIGAIMGSFVLLIFLWEDTGSLKWVLFTFPFLLGLAFSYKSFSDYQKNNKRKDWLNELPKDYEIDNWLQNDLPKFQLLALEKLNLTDKDLIAEPLCIYAPVFHNIYGIDSREIRRKVGDDDYYRYSVWHIKIYLLTANYIAKYECYYIWTRNNWVNESTGEFYYKDIVSVRTEVLSATYRLMNGASLQEAQSFTLALSGDKESIVYNSPELKPTPFVINNVDKAVNTIRTILRDKKTN